jgi:hypothetical protein
MNTSSGKATKTGEAARRLTALWALSEVGLGGAMHALRLPLTGLFVGGSAVFFITLLAWDARRRGVSPARVLLRSTALVLVVKAAAGPHSPVGAYLAVAFQGAAGALLFAALPGVRGPALLLGAVALLESAAQKLLMLTLFFGAPLAEAIDALGSRLLLPFGAGDAPVSISLWLVAGYVGAHAVFGLGIGYLAGRLPARARAELRRLRATEKPKDLASGDARGVPAESHALPDDASGRRKRRWWQWGAFLAALAASYALVGSGTGPWHRAGYVLLRTLGALALWYALIGPLLRAALRKLLRRSGARYALEVERTTRLLPEMRRLVAATWRETGEQEGRKSRRLARFTVSLVAKALLAPASAPPEKVAEEKPARPAEATL